VGDEEAKRDINGPLEATECRDEFAYLSEGVRMGWCPSRHCLPGPSPVMLHIASLLRQLRQLHGDLPPHRQS
jgi:hypothetical protein